MLKAVELDLLEDLVGEVKSAEAANRGNIAVLLWNMLRTPMWKIASENETNGMTSTAGSLMLNVKFPDYLYVEDAYLTDVSVNEEDVTAVVADKDGDVLAAAAIEDVDLARLVLGMKVSTLIKDYKDADDATFLTLTPEYSFVEGVVTKVTSTRIEIDEVEYRLDDADELFEVNDYVVAEVDGKKVTSYDEEAVIKALPVDATEVEKIKSMESRIDEEALVIIDGEWATREDIEVGDMFTEMTEFGGYYMVARERVEGAFESYTYENDGDEYAFVEVDGEKYRAFEDLLEAFEGEDNDEEVLLADLAVKAKDNKYLDQDVELVLNYLGQVVKMYFGEVSELDAQGDFYAMTSDGTWYTSSASGKVYHVVLAGVDGEEETYDFATRTYADAYEAGIYASGDPVFVWAKFNDDNEIKELHELVSGEVYGDYTIEGFSAEIDDDNYLNNATGSKVTASTVVFTVTPVEDEDDIVVGFEVEVSQGADALDGVTDGLVAFETEATNKRAKFVFVAEDARSQDLNFGLVEKVTQNRGIVYATISGTEYKVELEPAKDVTLTYADIRAYVDSIVAFTEDEDAITIKADYTTADLDDANVVTDVDDEFITFDEVETIDSTLEAVVEQYEDFTFVRASVYADKDNVLVFEADVEELGKGIENATFKKGDRAIIDEDNDVVVIVAGLDHDDYTEDGMLVLEPTTSDDEITSGDENEEVSGDENEEVSGDENEEVSGDEVSGDEQ
jgi:ATP:corrinoid adenosyltransferase